MQNKRFIFDVNLIFCDCIILLLNYVNSPSKTVLDFIKSTNLLTMVDNI